MAVKILTTPRMERCIGCHCCSLACLFARGAYTDDLLADCLRSVGQGNLADNLGAVTRKIQHLRWKTRITTGKGQIDEAYLASLKVEYAKAIRSLALDPDGDAGQR